MRRGLALSVALPVALLAACAAPPPPIAPTLDPAIEEAFESTAVAPMEIADDWWTSFDDPTLDELVEQALLANYDLKVAAANFEAARAATTIAGADRWPQLNGSASRTRTEQALIGFPIPGDVPKTLSTSYRASLDLSWEIDLWNRLGLRERAAIADAQAAEFDLAAARLSLEGQVTKAWFDLKESRAQLELAERTAATFEETAATARQRYERGLISAVDVHLTRASAENARALVAQRRVQRDAASRRLEILLGRAPQASLDAEGTLPSIETPVPAGLPIDLLERRPDLLALERRLVASGARTGEAERNLLPRITLTGSAGLTSTEAKDVLGGDFSVWSIAGGLLQPIFQGGRLRAIVRQNASLEEAARARWMQRVITALGEVDTALKNESALAERERRLRNAADAAHAAAELAESRYRQGLGDLLSVLDAQRRALDAESQWLSLRNAHLQSRVDVHLALGGGFHLRGDDTHEPVRSK